MIPFILLAAAVSSPQPLSSSQSHADYNHRLEMQPRVASNMQIPENISPEERAALEFLYAYMATPDILDYGTDFYLRNIRQSLKASREMPWGDKVPEREWKHFVLPIRVNNENLDDSRTVFYEELKDRIKGMSMKDAILEVNHWCHEKVSYQPSDPRTSSPLATVCNALGRCGEESTFTVAALRSVGIPARQVYTPRWAHTDDNHAWVEAWADGQWYFLGACEPEAVLNLAWFNAPASRGILMNTKVTGAYDGKEEHLDITPISTVINVTENYAPVRTTSVIVTDKNGLPVENATVNFSLYNYAEFYPLAVKKTEPTGYTSLTTGCGDIVVWASDGKNFGVAPVAGDTLYLTLDKDVNFRGVLEFDLVPPPPGGSLPPVSKEASELNDRRKVYEDSVRNAYVSTFLTRERSEEICRELGLDLGAADLLVKSRGNHKDIEAYLRTVPAGLRPRAVTLLGVISEKDLHDVTPRVLDDHLKAEYGEDTVSRYFAEYILNPRVENEMLTPYKKSLRSLFTDSEIRQYRANPRLLEKRMTEEIEMDNKFNPAGFRQSPGAVWKNKTADRRGRSIAFVATCRSLGIPARINPVSGATEFVDSDNEWKEVFVKKQDASEETGVKGELQIVQTENIGREPKYYSQFTISRIEDGLPHLLEFDEFESLASINSRHEKLAPGQYVLISGQRLADGAVLARAEFFGINPGEVSSPELVIRQDTTALQVIGNLDAELLYKPMEANAEPKSILSTTGRGYYVLGLIAPGHEPSAHAVNDIAAVADELAATGRTILLLFPDEESATRYRASDYGVLPENVVFGIDNGSIAAALREGLELQSDELPIFVVADTFNRVVFLRQGYSIHLGERLLDTLRRLD